MNSLSTSLSLLLLVLALHQSHGQEKKRSPLRLVRGKLYLGRSASPCRLVNSTSSTDECTEACPEKAECVAVTGSFSRENLQVHHCVAKDCTGPDCSEIPIPRDTNSLGGPCHQLLRKIRKAARAEKRKQKEARRMGKRGKANHHRVKKGKKGQKKGKEE